MLSLQRSTACSFSAIFSPFYHPVAFHILLTVSLSPTLRNSCGARYLHRHCRLSLTSLWELICKEASRQNYYLIKKTAAQLSDHCLIISCSWRLFHINEHCCGSYTWFTVSSPLLSYCIIIPTCMGQSLSSREELTGQAEVPLRYSVCCFPGTFSQKATTEPRLSLKGTPYLSQPMGCPGLWPQDITTTKGKESLRSHPKDGLDHQATSFAPWKTAAAQGLLLEDVPHPYLLIWKQEPAQVWKQTFCKWGWRVFNIHGCLLWGLWLHIVRVAGEAEDGIAYMLSLTFLSIWEAC